MATWRGDIEVTKRFKLVAVEVEAESESEAEEKLIDYGECADVPDDADTDADVDDIEQIEKE